MQLRRMADASLALAERRPDDLKEATERLGQAPPTNRQLLLLRFMGLVAPPPSAGILARVRGIVLIILLVVALLALGFGIVKLIALPFGGISLDRGIFYGLVLVLVALGVLVYFGRRRQKRARPSARRSLRAALSRDGRCAAATRSQPLTRRHLRERFPIGEPIEVRQRFNVAPGRRCPRGHDRPRRARRVASCCAGASSRPGPRARTRA